VKLPGKELFILNHKIKKFMKKKAPKARKQKDVVEMSLVNRHAAGVGIGDTEHVVAVPEDCGKDRVKKFGTMTCDLESYR
jgi:hypothetical protein